MKKTLFCFLCILTLNTITFADARPTQDDFMACFQKAKPSIVSVNGTFGIAIDKDKIAVPKNSDTVINSYIKFDPYLQLYLVHSKQTLEPIRLIDATDTSKIKKSTWVGVLADNNASVMGHIKSFSNNIGDLDTLSFSSPHSGLVSSACCNYIGISVGNDKFIPTRYLKHFMAYNDVYYGDISVDFMDRGEELAVAHSDPLGRGRALLQDDIVLSVNGKKPKNLRELNEAILFAPKGSVLDFLIKRDDEKINLKIPVSGSVDFSFDNIEKKRKTTYSANTKILQTDEKEISQQMKLLNDYGIEINSKLRVQKVTTGSKADSFGVSVGDEILQVGPIAVKNKSELEYAIGKDPSPSLLLKRDDFQYFLKVMQ